MVVDKNRPALIYTNQPTLVPKITYAGRLVPIGCYKKVDLSSMFVKKTNELLSSICHVTFKKAIFKMQETLI